MITRPITRPMASPIARALTAGAAIWNPRALFALGEQGWWFDNNDLSTMFQDSAGTIPVTGPGQPVGLQLDKSGRGNHRFQVNAASRPILRQNATTGAYYLETDGSDDWMVTNSIDFTGTDKVTLMTGVRKLTSGVEQILCELGSTYNIAGAFSLNAVRSSTDANFSMYAGTALGGTAYAFTGGKAVPTSAVTVAQYNRAVAPSLIGILDGTLVGSGGTAVGGKFGNYPAYFFRRGGTTLPFNGHEYSSICVGRLCIAAEIAAVGRLLAQRTVVTLA